MVKLQIISDHWYYAHRKVYGLLESGELKNLFLIIGIRFRLIFKFMNQKKICSFREKFMIEKFIRSLAKNEISFYLQDKMALKDTISFLTELFQDLSKDLSKASRGNKTAAQRVRVRTIELEKVAKQFRKESLAQEKKKKSMEEL